MVEYTALAGYARERADVFGQVLAVIKRGERMWTLELGGVNSQAVQEKLANSQGAADIEAVFEAFGGIL